MRIDACFDSHVHWAATGEFTHRLSLSGLKSADEVLALQPETHHFRADWLLGFGWDDNKWGHKPTRQLLDRLMPDRPVALSRCDGHALWVNSEALKRAGWLGGKMPESAGGRVDLEAGLLVDQAMDQVQKLIPKPSSFEISRHLLQAAKIFNEAGYTHIRDMTCNERQWREAVKLDLAGLLTLAVEEYFWITNVDELELMLAFMTNAREQQTSNLRVQGCKVFLDGALGSEGALLSRCYHGSKHSGLKLWGDDDLREVIISVWQKNFAMAVHVIGDQAADQVVNLCREIQEQGIRGHLHIEHAELLRPDTVEKMKGLDVICHLQPAHWLSDREWLQQKIGDLSQHAFPWRRLQEAGIPFYFGSDSPVEPASIPRLFQALRESAEAGVPRLLGQPTNHMSHKDLSWAPNSFTLIEDDKPVQVVFRGQHLV